MDSTKQYKTKILPALCDASILLGANYLREGMLVAMPTETVYGLAANALNPQAVAEIFAVKGRPQDNPLIVHIADLAMWEMLVENVTDDAKRLAEAFWPGPLTIILPKRAGIPDITTAGLSSVAVRMPAHPAALSLIKAANLPIAAPSANLSGLPSPTTASHCADDLWGKIPLILDGGDCGVGIESTVISLEGSPMVLRPGKISADEIAAVLKKPVGIAGSVDKPLNEGEQPRSPGMKYRHYAPKAKVIIIDAACDAFLNHLDAAPEGTFGLVFEGEEKLTNRPCVVYGKSHDPDSQAQGLFKALRTLDELGATLVFARCPDNDHAALGVYNRMLRAAGFEVKKL